jgi:hypothetical protein
MELFTFSDWVASPTPASEIPSTDTISPYVAPQSSLTMDSLQSDVGISALHIGPNTSHVLAHTPICGPNTSHGSYDDMNNALNMESPNFDFCDNMTTSPDKDSPNHGFCDAVDLSLDVDNSQPTLGELAHTNTCEPTLSPSLSIDMAPFTSLIDTTQPVIEDSSSSEVSPSTTNHIVPNTSLTPLSPPTTDLNNLHSM